MPLSHYFCLHEEIKHWYHHSLSLHFWFPVLPWLMEGLLLAYFVSHVFPWTSRWSMVWHQHPLHNLVTLSTCGSHIHIKSQVYWCDMFIYPFDYKWKLCAGEMTQQIKCLLHRHRDLSSELWHPCTQLGTATQRQAGPRACQPVSLAPCSVRNPFSKLKWSNMEENIPMSTSGFPWVHMGSHGLTHKHIQRDTFYVFMDCAMIFWYMLRLRLIIT